MNCSGRKKQRFRTTFDGASPKPIALLRAEDALCRIVNGGSRSIVAGKTGSQASNQAKKDEKSGAGRRFRSVTAIFVWLVFVFYFKIRFAESSGRLSDGLQPGKPMCPMRKYSSVRRTCRPCGEFRREIGGLVYFIQCDGLVVCLMSVQKVNALRSLSH